MRVTWKETKDAGKALDALPRKHCTEGKLLFGLKDNPNDYVGALGRLPRTLRQMYVHAVQSFIWNQLVTERLSMGDDLMVGDLVQPDEGNKLDVFHVTEENISKYTIEDVVMSMPGFDVSYPALIKEKLDDILQTMG